MSTTISKLSIRLNASADGVRAGVMQAGGYLESLRKRVDGLALQGYGALKEVAVSHFGQMLSATAAINLATQAWHATVDKLGEAYERIDERTKRARQLGAEAQDLGAIEYVAARSTTLNSDGVFDSIRAMNNRIANASINPQDQLNTVFGQLGLDAKLLLDLPLEERFFAIADAIGGVQDASQRSAMTAKLFEETGSAWAASFGAGGEAVKGLFAEYDRIHGVLSSEDTQAVENLNDAIGRLSLSIEGLFEAMGAEGAEDLAEAVNAVTDSIIFLRDNAEALYDVWYVLSTPAFWIPRALHAGGDAAGLWREAAALGKETADAMERANVDPSAFLAAQERAKELAEERLKVEEAIAKRQEDLLDAQLQAANDAVTKADQLRESLEDPFERLQDELNGMMRLVDQDLLLGDEYRQAAVREGQELLDQLYAEESRSRTQRGDARGLGSIEFGSQAALSAIAASERRQQTEDARAREAARQRTRMTEHLRRIEQLIENPRQTLGTFELR